MRACAVLADELDLEPAACGVCEGLGDARVVRGDAEDRGQPLDLLGAVEDRREPTQDLVGRVAEHGLGAGVPERDPAELVGADDGDPRGVVDHAAHGVGLAGRPTGQVPLDAHGQGEGQRAQDARDDEQVGDAQHPLGMVGTDERDRGTLAAHGRRLRTGGDDQHPEQGVPEGQPHRGPSQRRDDRHGDEPGELVVAGEADRHDREHRTPGEEPAPAVHHPRVGRRDHEERQDHEVRRQVGQEGAHGHQQQVVIEHDRPGHGEHGGGDRGTEHGRGEEGAVVVDAAQVGATSWRRPPRQQQPGGGRAERQRQAPHHGDGGVGTRLGVRQRGGHGHRGHADPPRRTGREHQGARGQADRHALAHVVARPHRADREVDHDGVQRQHQRAAPPTTPVHPARVTGRVADRGVRRG